MAKQNKQPQTEIRIDNDITLEFLEDLADGFLRAKVIMCTPGVYPYLGPSGTVVWEFKDPSEIFHDRVLSISTLPVLDQHPTSNNGLFTVDNSWGVRGAVGNLRKEVIDGKERLVGEETIYDSDLIDDIRTKKRIQVSLGQIAIIDPTPGTYNGQAYTQRQTFLKLNHLAHPRHGRLGDDARTILDAADDMFAVRLDADELQQYLQNKNPQGAKVNDTQQPTVVRNDSEQGLISAIGAAIARSIFGGVRNDAAQEPTATNTEPATIESLQAENQTLRTRLDQMDATLKTFSQPKDPAQPGTPETRNDEAIRREDAKTRIELEKVAGSILGTEVRLDELDDAKIQEKVITKVFGADVRLDSLSDAERKAEYNAAVRQARREANHDDSRSLETRNDADNPMFQALRERQALSRGGKA